MIPKIGAALSRFLEPLKPVKKTLSASKTHDEAGGGHGNLPFEKWKQDSDASKDQDQDRNQETSSHSGADLRQANEATPEPEALAPGLRRTHSSRKPATSESASEGPSPEENLEKERQLNAQTGLTQVILDIHSTRKEQQSGSAIQSYESGSREQKSGTRLPKGSMLDKKVG